jgi:hypothetical protein
MLRKIFKNVIQRKKLRNIVPILCVMRKTRKCDSKKKIEKYNGCIYV